MNYQEELKNKINNGFVDYLATSGSRLYGTNRETSDYDYRGFIVPPLEYLVGINNFNDMDVPGADHKVFSLKRYLDLVLSGDPQLTELLFVPKEQVIKCNEVGQLILDNRKLFLSRKIYKRIIGFGYSEWRKAMGQRIELEKPTKTEETIISDIRNVYSPDKADMDTIIEILNQKKEKKIVPSLKDLGEKRKKEYEAYGYGVSSASHAIRLANELEELMLTGKITFPRPEASILRDIRNGKVSREDAENLYNEALKRAEKTINNTILPESPDHKKSYDLYLTIVKETLRKQL